MIPSRYKNLFGSPEKIENQLDSDHEIEISSKERKGHFLWKKVKYQLVEYHLLPAYLKDNEFIHRHYRAEWPLKHVLLSIFQIHNETLNVWTHLIGFFLFLFLTVYTAFKVPDVADLTRLQHFPDMLRKADFRKIHSDLLDCLHNLLPDLKTSLLSMEFLLSLSGNVVEFLTHCLPAGFTQMYYPNQGVTDDMSNMIPPPTFDPITRWPFFVFMGGAMFCLLASSTCHLLSCHSERMSYIVHRVDYAGIAVLITTSFYPSVYYSFMCKPLYCNIYLGLITVFGITTMAFSLLPAFQKPELRGFRAGLFFGMGVSGVAPVLHKLILYGDQSEAIQTTGYELLMGILYGLGALFYATRIPERWKPGKFDIAGQSHQIFHVLVVAAAYTHYQAGLVYLRWRDLHGCQRVS
ncbi:heptahelical transmembrane protein 4-like isoform X2 [Mercurialis annua]|uniref:heptahelical transmembrane protein 4-like isoform X2 n=1 Tax=Mercurialis annua TaxID=3986 RepID=UPI00215E8711|nr:heptahelical transmembrane protein 4-like isoform X2 [Mercurialis annua]